MLNCINEGVQEHVNISEDKNPVVIVHPYWLMDGWSFNFEDYDRTEPEKFIRTHKYENVDFEEHFYTYFQNLEKVIKNYKGALITLESESAIERTLERYAMLKRETDSYMVLTDDTDPTPLKIGWDGFIDFLNQIGAEQLFLAGGLYHKHSDFPGCLRFTEKKIEKHFKTIAIDELHYGFNCPEKNKRSAKRLGIKKLNDELKYEGR